MARAATNTCYRAPTPLLAEPLVTACYEAIDRYHLTERLADVLRYGEPDASTRRARLSRWNESLDGTDHAIYRIRAWVRDRYADALARSDRRLPWCTTRDLGQ